MIQGTFGQELRGSYVMVPFDVPRGTTAVRVKYCWADPPNLTGSNRSTLDLGLWSAQHGSRPWGTREFRGLRLAVSPAVLVPRPETETLVEVALERLPRDRDLRVLDLGTGSGAIALAIADERPRARVVATDVSTAAIEIAQGNAARLELANVEFRRGDWYAALEPTDGPFDLIGANPPYVAAGDPHLDQGDLPHEPAVALSPGGDGLDALRAIVTGATSRLVAGGSLVVEHGYDQADEVRALFEAAGFEVVASRRDLAGIPRVTAGRTGGSGSGT